MAEEDAVDQEAEVPETPETPNPAAAPERPPGYVPHEALHEQREHNKRLQEDLRSLREKAEKQEATFQKFLNAVNEKPPPDPATDPLGHFEYQNKSLTKQLGEVTEKLGKFEKTQTEQGQVQRVIETISSHEQDFRTQNPDYDAAVTFLKSERREEMKEFGVPLGQIDAVLSQEILAFANAALAQGKNPAQAAYNMAKRRGYKPKASAPNLETIAKGMEASKTIDSGGGAAGITLNDLSKLPDDQLNAIINDDKKWKALLAGKSVH